MSEAMEKGISVMVVDDDDQVRFLISRSLTRAGYRVNKCGDGASCMATFAKESFDLALVDLHLPDTNGLELLKKIKEASPVTEVIVITGEAEKKDAIDAIKLGAFDFFEKPVEVGELLETIKRTIKYQTVVQQRDSLSVQLDRALRGKSEPIGPDRLIGSTPEMKKVLADIDILKNSDKTPVLVIGESGTGKELVARAIHAGSPRAERQFVPVNCPAIPENLAESAFFGHIRGAFTGADSDSKGYFDFADGGTLFLDEISDMKPDIQAKLLRVLEDGTVSPVGAGKGHAVNVRIIAATNIDPAHLCNEGKFRKDLYFRLAHFKISLPPLRERKEDIPSMVDFFAKRFAHEMGKQLPRIDEDFLGTLREYDYPGNVRELKNIVERAMIESSGSLLARNAHLDIPVSKPLPAQRNIKSVDIDAGNMPMNLDEAQKALAKRAIKQANGNMSKAAKILGINRTKLYRLID